MNERLRNPGKVVPDQKRESKESVEPKIAKIGADRWQDYKRIYSEALEKEATVFAGLGGMNAKAYRQFTPEIWQALLGNKLDEYGDILQKEDKKNPRVFLGAEVNGKLVGIVNYKINQSEQTATINDLYVSAGQRGSHLGRKLMETALAEIKRFPSIKKVQLEVLNEPETAAARKLYHDLGFREPAPDPDVVQDDWGLGMDIKMEMPIKK